MIREGVKNTQRRGALKFVTKGRQTLTPHKNSYKDMNPLLNLYQQLRSPHKFQGQSMDISLPPVRILKMV